MTTFNEALAAHTDAVNKQLQQQADSIAEILELVEIVANSDAEREELAAKVAELEAQNTEAIDRLTALTEALQADDEPTEEPVTPDVTTEAVEPVTPDVTTESAPEVDVELPEPTEPAPTPIVTYDDSGLESPLPPVEIGEPSRPTPPSGVPANDATPIYGAGSGSAFDPMP